MLLPGSATGPAGASERFSTEGAVEFSAVRSVTAGVVGFGEFAVEFSSGDPGPPTPAGASLIV